MFYEREQQVDVDHGFFVRLNNITKLHRLAWIVV